jgi:hypothetical protein
LRKRHEAEYQAGLERDRIEQNALLTRQREEREKLQAPVNALKAQHEAELKCFNSQFIETSQSLGMTQDITQNTIEEAEKQAIRQHNQSLEWGI